MVLPIAPHTCVSRNVLERIAFIKQAQILDFSLHETKQLIDHNAGQEPCAEVRQIVRTRLAELDERIKETRKDRNELSSALAEWDEKGHICRLIEGITSSEISQAR